MTVICYSTAVMAGSCYKYYPKELSFKYVAQFLDLPPARKVQFQHSLSTHENYTFYTNYSSSFFFTPKDCVCYFLSNVFFFFHQMVVKQHGINFMNNNIVIIITLLKAYEYCHIFCMFICKFNTLPNIRIIFLLHLSSIFCTYMSSFLYEHSVF